MSVAVLVALLDEPDALPLSLLLTQRSSAVGSHRGQVSFAGGRLESGESVEQAAVREAEEELGFVLFVLFCSLFCLFCFVFC